MLDIKKIKKEIKGSIIGIPPLLWLILIVITPISTMFLVSFYQVEGVKIVKELTLQNYLQFFEKLLYVRILFKTLKLAFLVSISTIILAYPLAYFVSRRTKKFKNQLFMLIVVPLWISYLVRIIAWKTILGNHGLINSILLNLHIIKEPLSIFLYNQFAIYLDLTHGILPFTFISIYTNRISILM